MRPEVIAIGASAGGVEALKHILQGLKKPSHLSVLVVLHIPAESPSLLTSIYQDICQFHVKEAEPGEELLPETVYIAPPNYHLSAEANKTLSLSTEDPVNYSRPSIDILMDSVAVALGEKGCGILLTGANHDGAAGMARINKNGGLTIIQDPAEALYPQMPQSCLLLFEPDFILSLRDIEQRLTFFSGATNG